MHNTKTLAKNTVALVFGTLIPKAVTVILTVYSARVLGSIGLGQYAIATSFVGVFAIIADLGLNSLFIREVAKEKNNTSVYFWSMACIKTILSVVFLACVFISAKIFAYSSIVEMTVWLLAGGLVFSSFTSLGTAIFQAHEKMGYSAFIGIVNSLLLTVGGILALYFGFGVVGLGWVSLISSLVMVFIVSYIIWSRFNLGKLDINLPFLITIGRDSIPFAIISILITIYYRSDMLLLSKLPIPTMSNEEAVGIYSASYKLIDVLQMIPGIISTVVFPLFSRLIVEDTNTLQAVYKRILKYVVFLGVPMAFGITILAENIIDFIYGSEFALSAGVLRILVWSVAIIFVNTIIATMLTSIGKLRILIVISAMNVLLNVGLNLIVVPTWGLGLSYVGAGLTTLITGLVSFIRMYRYFTKNYYSLNLVSLVAKPLLASVIMGVFVYLLQVYLFLAVIVGIFIYVLALFILKAFDDEDKKIALTLLNKPVQ